MCNSKLYIDQKILLKFINVLEENIETFLSFEYEKLFKGRKKMQKP